MMKNNPPNARRLYNGEASLVQSPTPSDQKFDGFVNFRGRRTPHSHRFISPGDLCILKIPFSDCTGSKLRPGFILCAQGVDLVVAPLTTRAPRQRFDIELQFWAAAGLSRRSTIRCARLCSVSRTSVS